MGSFVLTYTTLVGRLKSYVERTDSSYVDNIPLIISLAEQRIAREVKVLGLKTVVNSSFTADNGVYAGNGVINKPARWRKTIEFNFGSGTGNNTRNPLFLRTYDFCRSYWPDPTQTDVPKYYCDYDYDHFLVVPTPASAYPFELTYYGLPQPLSEQSQTNWLTENAPDLILYACLLESVPFLKSAKDKDVWQNLYDRSAQALGGEDKQRQVDSQYNAKEVSQ